jgi:arabinofuranosyltransferase
MLDKARLQGALGGARAFAPIRVARWSFAILALAPVAVVLVAGFERRWIDDDGFINLRVVRNFLHGHGPVFNLDERVEAATSPLWVGVLAILGGLGIRLEHAAVVGGIALTGIGLLLAGDGASRLHDPRAGSLTKRLGRPALPMGAAIFATLPPVWDYASSGLETGLGIAWLGVGYSVLARRTNGSGGGIRRIGAEAAWIGMGPLIRPEFALYSIMFVVALTRAVISAKADPQRRSTAAMVPLIGTCACALPLAYEIFRMGYYASLTPNTAIAKEAFLSNLNQGRCYFDNFFDTYKLAFPLVAASVFWVAHLRDLLAARRSYTLMLTAGPTVAATLHVAYLVWIGGDYMHGRLFVPAVFAGLLPVMTVPIPAPPRSSARVALWASCAVVAGWLPICAFKLRVGVENVCNIGDERGWYSRQAHVDAPVVLESYRAHPFYNDAQKALHRIETACPTIWSPRSATQGPGCRNVFMDDSKATIVPAPTVAPMASDVDARVDAVLSAGAIGILGYAMPENVHVVDLHGLADPVVARFSLRERGRPGHEKRLTSAWMLARFSQPASDDDASIVAARHALHCGTLSSLVRAVTAPLTFRILIDNVAHAWAYSHLRISADPFDAEQQSCETPRMPDPSTGGTGGAAFRWRCPSRHRLSGMVGSFKAKDLAISRLQPMCRGEQGADESSAAGPAFGEPSDAPFEVACPGDAIMTGIHGWVDNLVRSVGLVCTKSGVSQRTANAGADRGHAFELDCPAHGAVLGIEGRSGTLIDAIGILCTPTEGETARAPGDATDAK